MSEAFIDLYSLWHLASHSTLYQDYSYCFFNLIFQLFQTEVFVVQPTLAMPMVYMSDVSLPKECLYMFIQLYIALKLTFTYSEVTLSNCLYTLRCYACFIFII